MGSRQQVFAAPGRKTCISARHLHQSAGPLTVYYFPILFQLGSRQDIVAPPAAKPACRPAIFTRRPDNLLIYLLFSCFPIFLFYYFISIGFQAGGFCISDHKTCISARHLFTSCFPISLSLFFISIDFQAAGFCISGRKTCMSAHHFHRSAGPFTILLFFCFAVLLFSYFISTGFQAGYCCTSGRGPQNLHVGQPFSPVGISQSFIASRAANPACRLTVFCMSAKRTPPPRQQNRRCVMPDECYKRRRPPFLYVFIYMHTYMHTYVRTYVHVHTRTNA